MNKNKILKTPEEYQEIINNTLLENPNEKRVYRLSLKYIARTLILLLILFIFSTFNGVSSVGNKNSGIVIIITIVIYLYIIYILYTLFKSRLIVEKDKIISGKNKLSIEEISNLEIKLYKVANKKSERCLFVKDKSNKEYIFRLNIGKSNEFIKQISLLSGLEVTVKE